MQRHYFSISLKASKCLCGLMLALSFCVFWVGAASADPPVRLQPSIEKSSLKGPQNTKQAPDKPSYQEWLRKYQAWDKLDDEFNHGEQTSESILQQAKVAMLAGEPARVLEILEDAPSLQDDNATKADRLWLGAQAYRALGDPEHAVLWHLQAGELMPLAERIHRMQSEPGLQFIWKDVFRKLYHVYIHNSSIGREAQGVYLEKVISQAAESWSTDKFWDSVKVIFAVSQGEYDASDARTKPNDNKMLRSVAQAVATSVLRANHKAIRSIKNIDNEREALWIGVVDRLSFSNSESLLQVSRKIQPSRAQVFASGGAEALLAMLAQTWSIHGKSPAYLEFMKNLSPLSIHELHLLFKENRAESLMIGAVPEKELRPLRLALAIAVDDRKEAEKLWGEMDSVTLPSSLKLAGILYFDYNFEDIFRRKPDMSREYDLHWLTLLEIAGHKPPLPYMIPFWQPVVPEKNRTELIRNWPLDLDVMLEVWKYDWSLKPKRSLARRITYLYPTRPFGRLCALYLAEESLKDKQLALSEYYLAGVDVQDANATLTADYYRVSAELLVYKDDIDGAYAAYQQLIATGAPIDDTTRMKIAFLLQQRGELEAGREHLLKLWARKDDFATSMQAEILFYLAEGEQAMGLSDKALDYYLHLAWEYPQESMWALTAMYRAASIYEAREQYDPALKLLKTVVKNAATPKQREAAQMRLENVEAHRAKNTEPGTGAVPYPF